MIQGEESLGNDSEQILEGTVARLGDPCGKGLSDLSRAVHGSVSHPSLPCQGHTSSQFCLWLLPNFCHSQTSWLRRTWLYPGEVLVMANMTCLCLVLDVMIGSDFFFSWEKLGRVCVGICFLSSIVSELIVALELKGFPPRSLKGSFPNIQSNASV